MYLGIHLAVCSTNINKYLALCQVEAPVLGILLTVERKGTQYKNNNLKSLIHTKIEGARVLILLGELGVNRQEMLPEEMICKLKSTRHM